MNTDRVLARELLCFESLMNIGNAGISTFQVDLNLDQVNERTPHNTQSSVPSDIQFFSQIPFLEKFEFIPKEGIIDKSLENFFIQSTLQIFWTNLSRELSFSLLNFTENVKNPLLRKFIRWGSAVTVASAKKIYNLALSRNLIRLAHVFTEASAKRVGQIVDFQNLVSWSLLASGITSRKICKLEINKPGSEEKVEISSFQMAIIEKVKNKVRDSKKSCGINIETIGTTRPIYFLAIEEELAKGESQVEIYMGFNKTQKGGDELVGKGGYKKVVNLAIIGFTSSQNKEAPKVCLRVEIGHENEFNRKALCSVLKEVKRQNLLHEEYSSVPLLKAFCYKNGKGKFKACMVTDRAKELYYAQSLIIEPNDIRAAIYSLTKAIEKLHKKNIVHCDLKLQNVLVTYANVQQKNEFGGAFNAYPADFGLATRAGKIIKGGTVQTLPPEAVEKVLNLQKLIADPKADIWSLGIIFYQLFKKDDPPWYVEDVEEIKKIFDIVKATQEIEGDFERYLGIYDLPNEQLQLLKMCLKYNAEKRATASEIIDFLERNAKISWMQSQ